MGMGWGRGVAGSGLLTGGRYIIGLVGGMNQLRARVKLHVRTIDRWYHSEDLHGCLVEVGGGGVGRVGGGVLKLVAVGWIRVNFKLLP